MGRIAFLSALIVLGALGVGCVDSSGGEASDSGSAPPPSGDSSVPVTSLDGSVDGASPLGDGATGTSATFTTGLGAGSAVTHSAHFTLVTRTGGTPGGSGVKSSSSFKVISGVAPAAK